MPTKDIAETWQTAPLELGPLYPLVGWEVPMTVLCGLILIGFLTWKIKSEIKKYDHQSSQLTAGDE